MTLFLYLFGDPDACSHYNTNFFVVKTQVGYRSSCGVVVLALEYV